MEEKTTINRKIKKIMHILNPLAGKGQASKIKENLESNNYVYMSDSADEAADFIKKACVENPETCFTVYGGDGTVFKAVNALMESGYNDLASLKIVPIGSGNDFVHTFEGKSGEFTVDVMKFNGRYAANVINMGFDCEVVRRAISIKKVPIIPNKFAYYFGVAGELFSKKPFDATINLTYPDGTTEEIKEKVLLAAVANCRYYGGGFEAAPAAKPDDGLLDVVIINDVSIPTFVSLVGNYKNGTHVDRETGEVIEKFKKFLIYKKCVAVKIEGCKSVCADGEIFEESSVDIEVIPKAINYVKD